MNETLLSMTDVWAEENPPNMYRFVQNLLTCLYGVLSVLIICHFGVAFTLIWIIAKCKCTETEHNCIYVLALTVVDALVICHLPLLAVEIRQQQWTFGLAWCRFFWVAESVNKILSTFLLTALCFDRYLAVCYPLRVISGNLRRPRTACLIIAVCTGFSFALLSPMYSNAALERTELDVNTTVIKCVIDWSADYEHYFTIMLFFIGYCIPLILMTFFYCRIIVNLRNRNVLSRGSFCTVVTSSSAEQARRFKVVTKRCLMLAVFYFLCWTPFWSLSWYANLNAYFDNDIVIGFYFVHALVYLNSAMNPIFYVLLNRQFRQYVNKKRSPSNGHVTTSASQLRLTNSLLVEVAESKF